MSIRSLALCAFGTALATATPAVAGDGTKLLALIPEDTQIVFVFDVADARDSPLLMKQYDKLLAGTAGAKERLAEIGIDPLKDLDTVLFAGSGSSTDLDAMKSKLIIVEGRVPKDRIAAIPGITTSAYQGVKVWTDCNADAAFISNRLFVTTAGNMPSVIDVVKNKGKHKGRNLAVSKKAKQLRDAIATTDTSADLWATVVIPEKSRQDIAKNGMSADTVSLGVNLAADLTVGLRVNTDSDASAKKIVDTIGGQLAQVSQMLGPLGLSKAAKSLLISNDKAAVKLSATVTEAELEAILKLAKNL